MNHRVVITGMGIWSSIGQDLEMVTESLRFGRSGIIFDQSRIDYGLQSGLVGNVPRPDIKPYLSRATRQMMPTDGEFAYMAVRQALEQANITEECLLTKNVGIIWGNDGNSHRIEYAKIMEEEHCSFLVGYNSVFRCLTSSTIANLGSIFHLRGINLGISSACASGTNAIGIATMFIRQGLEKTIIVGGSADIEKENIEMIAEDAVLIDTRYNSTPTSASRPFDKDAVGSILSGGASALVLEDYEHAIKRGAFILAEIVGYGYAGGGMKEVYNGCWETDYKAMNMALTDAAVKPSDIDFVHARADSFPVSDKVEAQALQRLFSIYHTPISSTDSMAGHELWAAGSNRFVYSVLMLQNNFIAPTINFTNPIEEAAELNIIRNTATTPLNTILINSAGIGGSNAAIVIRKA